MDALPRADMRIEGRLMQKICREDGLWDETIILQHRKAGVSDKVIRERLNGLLSVFLGALLMICVE